LVGGYEPASKSESHGTRSALSDILEQGEHDYDAYIITNQTHIGQTYNDRIAAFMADAAKFVAAFVTPIVQSVPHIYISAIHSR
jgi:hypothetical protein